MKKMILGVAWQILGFLGAIIILCFAAPHKWDYMGITGILGSLLGLELIVPLIVCVVLFVVCVVLFVLGAVICFNEITSKDK